jgi:anaerobic selenocysteine-containing dehydrogenase
MSQSEILGGMLRGGRGPVAALTTQGLPPMPHWQPDPDDERQADPDDERQAARWPLRPSTAPGYFRSHTAFSGVSYLRRRQGAPCCILHPQEVGARGLRDGRHVRLLNDRGSVGLVSTVTDEVQLGKVLVPGRST